MRLMSRRKAQNWRIHGVNVTIQQHNHQCAFNQKTIKGDFFKVTPTGERTRRLLLLIWLLTGKTLQKY